MEQQIALALSLATTIGAIIAWRMEQTKHRITQDRVDDALTNAKDFERRLTALRSKAYLTDKDGVRRHWSKVSAEVRAQAESN